MIADLGKADGYTSGGEFCSEWYFKVVDAKLSERASRGLDSLNLLIIIIEQYSSMVSYCQSLMIAITSTLNLLIYRVTVHP